MKTHKRSAEVIAAVEKFGRKHSSSPLEHVEQAKLCEWLDWQHVPFFAVPNGATVRMGKLRAEGLKAGVPDLILPVHRIAIEMKRRDASPSDTTSEQLAWIEKLRAAGWEARVCKGADEAIAWLRELGMERVKRLANGIHAR